MGGEREGGYELIGLIKQKRNMENVCFNTLLVYMEFLIWITIGLGMRKNTTKKDIVVNLSET